MKKRLSLMEQRRVIRGISAGKKLACKKVCCQMRGRGLPMILNRIRRVLGPIAKMVGPVVMREFVAPYIKGSGLRLAGTGKVYY